MDSLPILLDGAAVGQVCVRQEGLYLVFSAQCRIPSDEVFRLEAVGDQGRLPLGIPAPCGDMFALTHRVSCREAGTAGNLKRAELRPSDDQPDGTTRWQTAVQPERLFRSGFLREQMRGAEGVLFLQENGVFRVALPYDRRRPFLLTSLFCFARVRTIHGKTYAVFSFDRNENPVLP
ncbi:MAG: hypothetical protein LKJ86_02925 [Oscillibacter sp.]|nr:hypothetical protein [Oscillibacter sp.]